MNNINLFDKDLYRFYGSKGPSFLQRLFKPLELRYIKWLRYCQRHQRTLFGRYILRLISKKTHIQIPPQVIIGKGFLLLHFGRVIINHYVVIGDNCTICPGVLIGQENRGIRRGNPIIGNDVYIGQNSTIVGKIVIGNDVLIAPNSFVNCDVPDHSIVVGNPAIIKRSDNATIGYIKNRV